MGFLSKSPDPEIVQVYDIFSPTLTKELARASFDKFESSRLYFAPRANLAQTVEKRSSVNAHLSDYEEHSAVLTSKIISRVTGLKLDSVMWSEYLQTLMYSIGGHINFHADRNTLVNSTVSSDYDRSRIATALLYLSHVERGGGTVFFGPEVRAEPIKGSAVFWFNLKSDLILDEGAIHAGCLIILGHKFVANKWIPVGEQMFIRKCSLKQRENFQFLVNGVPMSYTK